MSSICFSGLNDSECMFKQVKICEVFELCDVLEHLRHFRGVVSSLLCILTKQHGFCCGKYILKPPGNAISETLNVKMSPDASPSRTRTFGASSKAAYYSLSVCYLKTFLTALETLYLSNGRKWFEPFNYKLFYYM